MKLLVVAATPFEIQPFISYAETEKLIEHVEIEYLITGVGMVATAFALGRKLSTQTFDLAVNAGIAGAFDRTLQIGEVVVVKEDKLAELGAEDKEEFLSIDDLGFGESRFYSSFNHQAWGMLKEVSAITVNKVHGCEASIRKTLQGLSPQIETMEGAAFFYSCKQFNLPSIQLRSISNFVEPRNRESWNIPLAIKNLNEELIQLIKQLSSI